MKHNPHRIIVLLRQNSRQKLKSIAAKLDMPISSLFERMKTIRVELVDKYFTAIDFSKAGWPIHVFLALKADEDTREGLRKFCKSSPQVNSFSRVSGEYNYLLEALFKDIAGLEAFQDALTELGIRKRLMHQVIAQCKCEEFYTNEEHATAL